MRGSPLGIGSTSSSLALLARLTLSTADIGGSVRSPAANCGLYGYRATAQRVPNGGVKTYVPGRDSILGVPGPMAHSLRDIELFLSVVLGEETRPWVADPALLELAWGVGRRGEWEEGRRKLRVGVMRCDGEVRPLKPMERAVENVVRKLVESGRVEVVEFVPWKTREGWELARKLVSAFVSHARCRGSFSLRPVLCRRREADSEPPRRSRRTSSPSLKVAPRRGWRACSRGLGHPPFVGGASFVFPSLRLPDALVADQLGARRLPRRLRSALELARRGRAAHSRRAWPSSQARRIKVVGVSTFLRPRRDRFLTPYFAATPRTGTSSITRPSRSVPASSWIPLSIARQEPRRYRSLAPTMNFYARTVRATSLPFIAVLMPLAQITYKTTETLPLRSSSSRDGTTTKSSWRPFASSNPSSRRYTPSQ